MCYRQHVIPKAETNRLLALRSCFACPLKAPKRLLRFPVSPRNRNPSGQFIHSLSRCCDKSPYAAYWDPFMIRFPVAFRAVLSGFLIRSRSYEHLCILLTPNNTSYLLPPMVKTTSIILFASLAGTALAAKVSDHSNFLGYKPNTAVTGAAVACYAGAAITMSILMVLGRWPARYMLSMIIGAYG